MYMLLRNQYSLNGSRAKKNMVNIEFWNEKINIGDQISYIIFEWMLKNKGINPKQSIDGIKHLMGLGSIIGGGNFDAVIWGSGIHTPISIYKLGRWRKMIKYDIRAIRGPLTKVALESFGYDCSGCILGDPGIIMPLIYKPDNIKKKHSISIIRHFKAKNRDEDILNAEKYNYIDVETSNYEFFIDEILSSETVISSSLHGIILAESYGIPALFLNEDGIMDREIVKYYDWYYSTERYSIKTARSVEEALTMNPMSLPELDTMRENLIHAFPYDLWEDK